MLLATKMKPRSDRASVRLKTKTITDEMCKNPIVMVFIYLSLKSLSKNETSVYAMHTCVICLG